LFQLLQPSWLFASAAIIIPVIIHLWNIREGKTLYVGSLSLLQENARQQARSFKLKDLLLLILRCLLIIALAFLLAKPTCQKQQNSTNKKGWLLIEKESIHDGYNQNRYVVDSLIKAGYEFHYFNKGFATDNLLKALKEPADTVNSDQPSYWTLLKQLNEEVPAELPVYLVTDNKLRRFAGTRPEVSMNLHWRAFTSRDTIAKQSFKAYKNVDGKIRLVTANSKPSATFYTYETSNKTTDITPDTTTLRVAIYTDQFAADATYLKAAIDAIQQYTGLQIKASIVHNVDVVNKSDWLFWLSEKPLPKQDLPANVFMYERGKEEQMNSFLYATNRLSINQEAVHISRIVANNSGDEEALWKDGFGHKVLTLDKSANDSYHFYSHFNPGWNDIVWSSRFVEMIFKLFFKEDISIKEFDKRIIDAEQIQPVISKTIKGFDKEKFVETTDLTKLFWIITFLIFCIERYISLTITKQEVYA
jgi:hypothetical protein